MELQLSQLRAVALSLFDHLGRTGHHTIRIDNDYYWDIPKQKRYDPRSEPDEHTLGQLTDDWKELLRVLSGDEAPFAYAFVWLASVLRAIGEEVVA